jgi:predicted AAA+ superfamily ATPase
MVQTQNLDRLCEIPPRGSCLLLGPRQTGKSTLTRAALGPRSWSVDLLEHDVFLRFAREPRRFRQEAEEKIRSGVRTIFIDEVQKLPALLDEAHSLIESRGVRFLLTGSSARKLKRGGANLLAGRAAMRHLFPLTLPEIGEGFDLNRALRFGGLPKAVLSPDDAAIEFLSSCAQTYLREEIQAEALVRNLGSFARFLDIAAAQSGEILNVSAVARDAALAHPRFYLFDWRTRDGAEAHPGVPRAVVCLVPEAFRMEGIEVTPFEKFLPGLKQYLDA